MYMFIFCAMYVYELIEILWSSIPRQVVRVNTNLESFESWINVRTPQEFRHNWIELNWIEFSFNNNNNSNMMKLHINAVMYTE